MNAPDAKPADDAAPDAARITGWIENIPDPEIPAVTIGDLGMVRAVKIGPGAGPRKRKVRVLISPTYTGCPANSLILECVRETLRRRGFEAEVEKALFPPWTTDWITDRGRRKLRDAGIAPPEKGGHSPAWPALFAQFSAAPVRCVRCGGERTRRISQFGATPCKALYQCEQCREPFEYFKCF